MLEIIKLNVGGQVFHTTKATLIKHPNSFFGKLMSGTFEATKDDQGNIFLDRSPDYFKVVLEYLRNDLLPDDVSEGLTKEFEYYNINLPEVIISDPNPECSHNYNEVMTPDKFYKLIPVSFLTNTTYLEHADFVGITFNVFKNMLPNEKIIYARRVGSEESFTCAIAVTNYTKIFIIQITEYNVNKYAILNTGYFLKNNLNFMAVDLYKDRSGNLPSGVPLVLLHHGKRWMDPVLIKSVFSKSIHSRVISDILNLFD